MGMSMHDRYYEPADAEDEEEAIQSAVAYHTEAILIDEFSIIDEDLWEDGLKALGCSLEQYPTQSHAPMEIVNAVSEYYADLANNRAVAYIERVGPY